MFAEERLAILPIEPTRVVERSGRLRQRVATLENSE